MAKYFPNDAKKDSYSGASLIVGQTYFEAPIDEPTKRLICVALLGK